MDKCKCYLCEKLCYCKSQQYQKCEYRYQKSFGVPENREYEIACTRIAVKFARKHGWRFDGWIGHFDPKKHNWNEGAGGWANFDDMVYTMEDMRTDIMMDAHPDAITDYMGYCMAEYEAAKEQGRTARHINYRSWLMGARLDLAECSEAYLEQRNKELEEERERLLEEKKKLEEELQRYADELQAGSDGLY